MLSLEEVEALMGWIEAASNYSSAAAHNEPAPTGLKQDLYKKFLSCFANKEKLEKEVGPLVLLRVGAVVPETQGGRTKTRLIHDLRESNIIALATIPDRRVLPRLTKVPEARQ